MTAMKINKNALEWQKATQSFIDTSNSTLHTQQSIRERSIMVDSLSDLILLLQLLLL